MKLYAELKLLVPLTNEGEAIKIFKEAWQQAMIECNTAKKKRTRKKQAKDGTRWSQHDKIEFNGQKMTLTEWAEQQKMTVDSLRWRLNDGWTIAEALTRPTQR